MPQKDPCSDTDALRGLQKAPRHYHKGGGNHMRTAKDREKNREKKRTNSVLFLCYGYKTTGLRLLLTEPPVKASLEIQIGYISMLVFIFKDSEQEITFIHWETKTAMECIKYFQRQLECHIHQVVFNC